MGYYNDYKKSAKTKIKNLSVVLMIFMFLCFFTGCSNKYNAKLYSKANEWIDEEFLNANRVQGFYRNENYVEGETDKYTLDITSPIERVLIITDEDEYNKIFSKSELDVNFEKEMIILYISSNCSLREYFLKKIEVNDKILTIKIVQENKLKNIGKKDGVMMYQRCMVVKMNKIEINEVRFE